MLPSETAADRLEPLSFAPNFQIRKTQLDLNSVKNNLDTQKFELKSSYQEQSEETIF